MLDLEIHVNIHIVQDAQHRDDRDGGRDLKPGQQDDVAERHDQRLDEVNPVGGKCVDIGVRVMRRMRWPPPSGMHQAMVPVVGKVFCDQTNQAHQPKRCLIPDRRVDRGDHQPRVSALREFVDLLVEEDRDKKVETAHDDCGGCVRDRIRSKFSLPTKKRRIE